MLWQLMENGLEELKLLQTVLVLLTTNTVVHDEVLSKVYALISYSLVYTPELCICGLQIVNFSSSVNHLPSVNKL